MKNEANTILQLFKNNYDAAFNIAQSGATEIKQDWAKEETHYIFADGSILIISGPVNEWVAI